MRIPAFALCLFLSLSCLFSTQAQEKVYRKEKMNILGSPNNGFSTKIPYSENKTRQYLNAYLKESGKVSEKRNFIEIKETSWKKKEDLTKVYALVNGDSTQSRIWIGFSADASEELVRAVEEQMENLPFLMDKYHLQHQIKEAENAATFLSKELKNTEREGLRLNGKLEQNAQEKIRLEQAIEQNANEKIQLEQDIITNSKNQEDKAQALDEVKRQLDILKERLNKL